MKRCAECNRYNLFESKSRTEAIQFLVTRGYKESTLARLCIDCINKECRKVRRAERWQLFFKCGPILPPVEDEDK